MSDFDFDKWAEEYRRTPIPMIPPEKQEALRAICLAELERRGIDDVDAFLRKQEAVMSTKDSKP